jgi:hypothetical protein
MNKKTEETDGRKGQMERKGRKDGRDNRADERVRTEGTEETNRYWVAVVRHEGRGLKDERWRTEGEGRKGKEAR